MSGPEPQAVDEANHRALARLAHDSVLKGRPSGDERCKNCLFYIEESADISYCWHPKIRILVGAEWWCQWWEPRAEDE